MEYPPLVATRVLGVLAGDGTDPALLDSWARSAEVLLAADGGADRLLSRGLVPQITIGDLDSISPGSRERLTDVRLDPSQDSSDCDKLLALTAELGHRAITLIGAGGTRVDHMLAVLQSAARSGLSVRIAYERQLAHILVGPTTLELPSIAQSGLASLLPLTPCQGVDLTGVRWPLQDASLDPLGLTSLSNVALQKVRISLASGAAAFFHEYDGAPTWPH